MSYPALTVRPLPGSVFRWAARIISVPILLFWGYFIGAHMIDSVDLLPGPLAVTDMVLFAAVVVSLLGLAVAWKWELAGGLLTLLAMALAAVINWRVLVLPGGLIPFAALLFIASWFTCRGEIK